MPKFHLDFCRVLLTFIFHLSICSFSCPLFAKEEAVSPPRVGKLAPDFELLDLEGKTHRLSDFKGNFVFLNFWATWCPPCIEEIPAMEELNQRMKAKPFVMIAVSIDESLKDVRAFIDKLGKKRLSFLILHDPTKKVTTESYGSLKFPETYWLDKEGRLIEKFKGSFNWVETSKMLEIERYLRKSEASVIKKTK